jgi:beta-mannosidase
VSRHDGDGWQLRGWLGDEWRWYVNKPWDMPGWLPAAVPGSVLDDLARAGAVPDLHHGRNSRLAEWAPARTWIYRRRVEGPGRIRFEGVDHEATVFADGKEIGHHEGAFTPFEVELPAGEHLLAVAVHAAPESEPQVGRTSKVRVHKSRMGYGWDFCPRLIHQGIWRPVVLDPPPERFPIVTLEDDIGTVEIEGEVVLRVDSPELWWPNGLGEQHLYDAGGFQVGFREISFEDYELRVNGVAVPVKGWNWVPLDALYGVPRPQKLEHVLRLAQHANANLLRVWGGGLIETPEFYELCNRLGLLVWQEFVQSSSGIDSVPSDDPAFVATMVSDARQIVPRLRRHPSLAIWGGGNELDGDESTPVLAALRAVVQELDPGRPWLPTSPLGDADVHGPWEHQGLVKQTEHYDTRTSRLHSEFGVEGMTNRRTLARVVPEDERWPADRTNPVYEHLGAWWNNAPLVQELFGGGIDDIETMRRCSQWLQYEGLRYAVEATLRRGAGTIPWQFDEPYPNAWCTSALDYRGDPKPAYWGVARAYEPDHPSARFATWAWGGRSEVRAAVSAPARLVDLDGRVVAEDDAELAAPLDAFAHDVFLLDLGPGSRYVMTRTENLAPLLNLPRVELELVADSNYRVLRNTSGTAALGIMLEDARPYDAPGWVTFSDNVFDLLPGEERRIEVDGPVGELLVEGWNIHATA